MTAITTAIGFISLKSSTMPPIANFGLFSAIGIMLSLLNSIFLVPALIVIFKIKREVTDNADHQVKEAITTKFFKFTSKHTIILKIIIFLVVAGLAWEAQYVKIDNDELKYFKDNSEIVLASKKINDNLSGIYTLNMSIKSKDGKKSQMTNSEILQFMQDLEDHVKKTDGEHVKKIVGLHTFLKQINVAMNSYSDTPNMDFYEIPSDPQKYGIDTNLSKEEEKEAFRQLNGNYLSQFAGEIGTFVAPDEYEPKLWKNLLSSRFWRF